MGSIHCVSRNPSSAVFIPKIKISKTFISGPEGTPYEGGIFVASLKFPKDYPLSPPVMKFTSPIFHPNGMVF